MKVTHTHAHKDGSCSPRVPMYASKLGTKTGWWFPTTYVVPGELNVDIQQCERTRILKMAHGVTPISVFNPWGAIPWTATARYLHVRYLDGSLFIMNPSSNMFHWLPDISIYLLCQHHPFVNHPALASALLASPSAWAASWPSSWTAGTKGLFGISRRKQWILHHLHVFTQW